MGSGGTGEAGSGLGAAVRRRRRTLDLTLAAVAERSGLSVPFLSQIENERARPSMRSLQRVADALETTAVDLLAAADARTRPVDVVRADEPAGLEPASGVRPLVRGFHDLHALEFTGTHEADREFVHPGGELMYVADGAVEVEAEGKTLRLGPGDTVYLAGGVRHRWRTVGQGARVILVAVGDR
ncbi:helix-turn-helix domain-containing protein [Streptomyces olivaceus]